MDQHIRERLIPHLIGLCTFPRLLTFLTYSVAEFFCDGQERVPLHPSLHQE